MNVEQANAPSSPPNQASFRVELDMYRGPLDLLLYLVRKHEVDIHELPIAPIARQYLEFLEVIALIDVNAVGDFLETASTLAEIKSRVVLPRADEVEEEVPDPRQDLVRQLLAYKKYRDAASMLDERGRRWQERFGRLANDLPPRRRDLADEPIHELEIWDLVSAFSRIMRDREALRPTNIVYDETPIHVYMARIHRQLVQRGRVAFTELFEGGMHKSSLVSMFLAMMELVRHHGARAEQDHLFGEIWLYPGSNEPLDLSRVDNYEHRKAEEAASA
jgi:segregation and condensation protein A